MDFGLGPPVNRSAPAGRKLYISFAGTERTDWQEQLMLYGLAVFALGVVVGRASVSKPKLARRGR